MKQLEEIKARASAATAGPWAVDELGDVEDVPEFDLHRFDIMPQTIARIELRKEDGNFIAAARTDVPKLVAALEAVEGVLTWLDELQATDPHPKVALGSHVSAGGCASVIREAVNKALEAA